jgi:hypothetical protein
MARQDRDRVGSSKQSPHREDLIASYLGVIILAGTRELFIALGRFQHLRHNTATWRSGGKEQITPEEVSRPNHLIQKKAKFLALF